MVATTSSRKEKSYIAQLLTARTAVKRLYKNFLTVNQLSWTWGAKRCLPSKFWETMKPKVVLMNTQSQFASVVLDGVVGPLVERSTADSSTN